MITSRIARRGSLLALVAALVLAPLSLASSASPVHAATAPQLVMSPSSGPDVTTANQTAISTQGLDCPADTLVAVAFAFSSEIALPMSVTDSLLAFSGSYGYVDPESYESMLPHVAGDLTPTKGVFPDGSNTALGSWQPATSLSDVMNVPGSYALIAYCQDAKTANAAPDPANPGNAIAAVADISYAADGSWTQTNSSTPSAAPTTTSLSATADGTAGAKLHATVTSSAGTPTGSIQFFDNGSATPLDSSPVPVDSSGAADFSATGLSSGAHSIVARFTPTDGTFGASSSTAASVNLGATKASTTVSLTGTVTATQAVLTATVASGGATVTGAAGTVSFSQNGTVIAPSVSVANGVAIDTVTGLTAGTTYAFTATYTASASEPYSSSPVSPTLSLTAGAATPSPTPTADPSPSPSATTIAISDPGSGGGSVSPVTFATDWLGSAASTPAGMAGLFALLVALVTTGVAGWVWFWRRRQRRISSGS